MEKIIDWLMRDEEGQGTLEYGLILVLFSVTFILILSVLGLGVENKYTVIDATMP